MDQTTHVFKIALVTTLEYSPRAKKQQALEQRMVEGMVQRCNETEYAECR